MTFTAFDPRTLSTPVYEALTGLRSPYNKALTDSIISENDYRNHLKEQKNQAVELYTYLSTWGLMRLRAEEIALCKVKPGETHPNELPVKEKATKNQEGKREVIQAFFRCIESFPGTPTLSLESLKKSAMNTDEYLGLMGLGLAIAQEFSFWASVVYHDISGEE
jgi:hypothetical protein